MDFNSLSRRELQALCKRNKIPANLTNFAMADSLKALQLVEGIDEVLQASKSEISHSSIELGAGLKVTSPYVPPSDGRSTRQKDVLLTPAHSGVTSRRRRAVKEDSAVKQVYGTRRSARLVEKSAKLLKGVTEFSKKDLFTGDGQDFKINLEESLDGLDEVSGVTGMEEYQRKDEGQADSSDNVSTDIEVASATEEEVSSHSENDGSPSKLKEGLKTEEVELVRKIEEEYQFIVNDANLELNESTSAEIELVGFGPVIEEFGNHKCDDTIASDDGTLSLAQKLNDEAQETDGSDAVQTSETKITRIKAEKTVEDKTAEDAESVDEAVIENEGSSDTVIHSYDKVLNDVDSDEVVAFNENKEDLGLNTDSSETKSNLDESDSIYLDMTEESTKSSDSLACMPSEFSLMNDKDYVFNWDINKQDVAVEEEQVAAEQDVAANLATVVPNNIKTASMENAAIPSFVIQPTFSTPKRTSASKASMRRTRVIAASDNKENTGSEGKIAPAKERLKIVKEIAETVPMLDDPSLMKLSKNLKELTITQNLDMNEGENGASARTALQALPDNQKAN